MEIKGRLGVDKTGGLVSTNELDVTKFDKLAVVKGEVMKDRIILQPLPAKEKTINGIILPSSLNGEFRCAVIASHEDSKFKRGDVVMLKLSDFPAGPDGQPYPPRVDFVEGNACVVLYESFIWYKYPYRIEDNINLDNDGKY
jgi:hypothetical protein